MSPADGIAATLPLHPCGEVWSLHGGMVGDSHLDAEATAVVQAALGGRARAMARQGDAWREVVLDATGVPERLEIVAREADPLVVVVTLDRTRCSGTQDDRAPAWHDLDAAVELRFGDEVIDRWQSSGVVAEFVPASEMMQTTATIQVGTRAQHGLAQARDFGMVGILPGEAGLPPSPRLPLALAQDRSALLASLNDGPLVAWQGALVARMIAAPEGAPERARLLSLLVDAEAASVGFNRDGGGLGPEARAAIRAAVEVGSISPMERMELGAASLVGDTSLAGAVFQDVPGLSSPTNQACGGARAGSPGGAPWRRGGSSSSPRPWGPGGSWSTGAGTRSSGGGSWARASRACTDSGTSPIRPASTWCSSLTASGAGGPSRCGDGAGSGPGNTCRRRAYGDGQADAGDHHVGGLVVASARR